MSTRANRSRYLPLLIVGVAVVLSSTVGVAAIMGWLPDSTGGSGGIVAPGDLPLASAQPVALTAQAAPGQAGGEARAKVRCAECGTIVSIREIETRGEDAGLDTAGLNTGGLDKAGGTVARNQDKLRLKSARRYQMTVRLADGSSRVINHASPASWRPGERVIVIDGTHSSNR